jgi:Na+-transporting methylmalonyl-CoA/oxaloacetate decarboxylase gamma subunit
MNLIAILEAAFNKDSVLKIEETLLISALAILIVFAVLIVIILVSGGFSKGLEIVDKKTKILPKEENKILEEDEDAVAAALVATIEYHKETKENARLKSIKRID